MTQPKPSNEVDEPDKIEQLYIESSGIGLVEFRSRINDLITQHTASVKRESRIDEIKLRLMFDPNDTSPEFDELLHKHGTYEAARLKQLNSQGDTDAK